MSNRQCASTNTPFTCPFLSLFVFFLLSFFPSIAFPEADGGDVVIVTVTLNEEAKGEFFVYLARDGDILMSENDVRSLGIEKPSGQCVQISGESHISLRSMDGVRFVFDERRLEVRLDVDPALLPKRVIDFLPARQPKVYYPQDTSAFFNYRLDYYAGKSFDFEQFMVTNEVGFRAKNVLFFSDAFYAKKPDDDKFVRLMTNVTYDDRATLRRFVTGDFVASSGDLGSTLTMGGVSLSKVYRMDPYLIKNPMLNVSGFVSLPSEVEIYLNGMRLRTERLSPGGFDLRNISYYGGTGLLEVVIKDPFGKEERIAYPFYFSDSLLRKSLHEYSYNLGALRKEFGEKSNAYGKVAFSAFHRYGYSDSLTVGYHAEALKDFCTVGPQASYLIRDKGILSIALSQSLGGEGKNGTAGILGYTYQERRFSARFFAAAFSKEHTRIADEFIREKPKFEVNASIGYATQRYGSFSVDVFSSAKYRGEERKAVVASYSKALSARSTVFATFRHIRDGQSSNEFFVGINYYPGKNHTVSASHRQTADARQEVVQVVKNVPVGEGVSYRASLERTETRGDHFASVNPFVQYHAKRGIVAAETKIDFDREGNTREAHRLSAAGSIAYVGGTLGLSRPVVDSFGLVKVGDLKDVKVFHNNEEIGRTNSSGKVFIPNLTAFIDNQITIDDKDIPLDYTISEVMKYVSPPYRSGSFIVFDAMKFQAMTGKLLLRIDRALHPAEFSEVILLVNGEKVTFPTGKGGEFYLENIRPGRYPALLKYSGKECKFDMIIPKSEDMIVDLGEVVCALGD